MKTQNYQLDIRDVLDADNALHNIADACKYSKNKVLESNIQKMQNIISDFSSVSNEIIHETENELNESEDDVSNDPKIQKMLKKLISEETIAGEFYMSCILAASPDQAKMFCKLFADIATDEVDDHRKELVEWALNNGYDIPFKQKDFEKFAEPSVVKQLNNLKGKQDAIYYVEEAIKSEEDALKSYEDAMNYENVPYDLNAILLKISYEEKEHFENLHTLLLGCQASTYIQIC